MTKQTTIVVTGALRVTFYYTLKLCSSLQALDSHNSYIRYSQINNMKTLYITLSCTYSPSDINRKGGFCLAFYFKWKYYVLTDLIESETICRFYFCVLFTNIYPKIKFMTKNWSDLCHIYSKVIFWIFYKNIFYFSLLSFNYWDFTTLLWKFQKIRINGICWKPAFKLPTLSISA